MGFFEGEYTKPQDPLTTVSVEAINTIAQGMVESVIKYQGMEVEQMIEDADEHIEKLKSALKLDNEVVSERYMGTRHDEKTGKTYKIFWRKRAHVKLVGASNIGEVTNNFAKAQREQQKYNEYIDNFKSSCEKMHGSAAEIQQAEAEIIKYLTDLGRIKTKDQPKKEEPTEKEATTETPTTTEATTTETPSTTETTTTEENPTDDNPGTDTYGGNPGGGDYGGGGSGGGGGYTPAPTPTQTPTEEEPTDENTDYGDGDEGKEVEPTVATPNVTIPTVTQAPTPTVTQTQKPTEAAQPTQAPTEKHTGGGYSASGGYKYDNSAPETTEEEALQEEAASSIDNIINGRTISKIPTSSAPIARIRTTSTKGSSIIPAASGIAAAAVIGLGAKAYLDKKKAQEDEEEEEMFE